MRAPRATVRRGQWAVVCSWPAVTDLRVRSSIPPRQHQVGVPLFQSVTFTGQGLPGADDVGQQKLRGAPTAVPTDLVGAKAAAGTTETAGLAHGVCASGPADVPSRRAAEKRPAPWAARTRPQCFMHEFQCGVPADFHKTVDALGPHAWPPNAAQPAARGTAGRAMRSGECTMAAHGVDHWREAVPSRSFTGQTRPASRTSENGRCRRPSRQRKKRSAQMARVSPWF